jgi:hypothetical protein
MLSNKMNLIPGIESTHSLELFMYFLVEKVGQQPD